MSLKNISLDPYLIAQLFNTPIVSPETKAVKSKMPPLSFLGGNKKKITVFINNETNPWLPDDLFQLLTNILQACRLSMDDIALVNAHQNKERKLSDYIHELQPVKIIFLGEYFGEWLNSSLTKNNIGKLEKCDSLWSFSLKEMQTNQQAKKVFWQNLQLLFNLKK